MLPKRKYLELKDYDILSDSLIVTCLLLLITENNFNIDWIVTLIRIIFKWGGGKHKQNLKSLWARNVYSNVISNLLLDKILFQSWNKKDHDT